MFYAETAFLVSIFQVFKTWVKDYGIKSPVLTSKSAKKPSTPGIPTLSKIKKHIASEKRL